MLQGIPLPIWMWKSHLGPICVFKNCELTDAAHNFLLSTLTRPISLINMVESGNLWAPCCPNVQCQHRPVWHQPRPLHVTPTHPCHTRIENTQPPVVPECSVVMKLRSDRSSFIPWPQEREKLAKLISAAAKLYNFPQATDKTLYFSLTIGLLWKQVFHNKWSTTDR